MDIPCQVIAYVGVFTLFAVVGSAAEPPITAVAFAPDGKSVVAIDQSGAHEFGWPTLERLRTIETTASNLHCLAFSSTGRQLAVGGGDPAEYGSVQVLSWPEGKSVRAFDGHSDSVRSVAWVSEAMLLSASIDREIKLWALEEGDDPISTLAGHSRSVDAICLLTEGKTVVSAGVDQSVRVWDLESSKLIRSLNQHTKPVHALALRPAQKGLPMVASAAGDRTIRFWQPTIGRMLRYARLEAEPLNIAWIDGSRIAASCVDGRVRIVNADEVTVLEDLPAIAGWAYAMAVHPLDGSLVVGGSDGAVRRVVPRAR